MNAQLKYSFKKERALFFRGFKLLGILLAIFGFALVNPIMFGTAGAMLEQMNDMEVPQIGTAVIQVEVPAADDPNLGELGELAGLSSASSVFAVSLVMIAMYSSLIIMLVMMKPAGGEQKKRAMIVPLCCGLDYKSYLIPKFVIYPLSVFAAAFLGGLMAGGLCGSMFEKDRIYIDTIALASLMMAVYMAFVITVYLTLGLCSSRPGVMVGVVFLGQMILPSLLQGMGLTDYQPFSLITMLSVLSEPGGAEFLSNNIISILVSIAISIAIEILLFFVTLAVLNGKRIDNQEENMRVF